MWANKKSHTPQAADQERKNWQMNQPPLPFTLPYTITSPANDVGCQLCCSSDRQLPLKKNGSVNGDLTTAQIIIEDGAYFKSSIEIEKSAEKEADKDGFSRTASAPATPPAGAEPGVSNHEGMLTAGRTANSRRLSPAC
jgi:hypothetical protein